jgi:hypothetical protein
MSVILNELQRMICEKYKTSFLESPSFLKVGISKNIRDGVLPINGVRYHPEGDTTGWYFWGGEQFSEDPDFFVPLHVAHLEDWNPVIIKYLGLPPGWRFLVHNDFEDVWFDEEVFHEYKPS